ncbi:hypothetical protein A4X13_0g9553, partial [Tilletia indica]
RLCIDEQATQATDLTDSETEAFNTVAQQGKAMRRPRHRLTLPRAA